MTEEKEHLSKLRSLSPPLPSPLLNGYFIVGEHIRIQFFKISNFCLELQKYLQTVNPSVQIEIKKKSVDDGYTIQISTTSQQDIDYVHNQIENLLASIKTKVFDNEKVQAYLRNHSSAVNIISRIIDHKKEFIICEIMDVQKLKIHYFKYKMAPFKINDIDEFINKNIIEDTINVLLGRQQTQKFFNELKTKIDAEQHKADSMISISMIPVNNDITKARGTQKQQQIRIFGYYKRVNELKKQFQNLCDKHQLTITKINMSQPQVDYLLYTCSKALKEIQKQFKADHVDLRISTREFLAPSYLKDKIQLRIKDLLSSLKTKEFKTIKLFHSMIEKECEQLKNIAHQNNCHISKYDLETKLKTFTISKATSQNTVTPKSILEQSDLLYRSTDIVKKVMLANGSINVSIGDIADEKVDTIIIPSTSNGLRENIIERAGIDIKSLKYNQNQQKATVTLIETNSGKLPSKTILFSNWTPSGTYISSDDILRKSIQVFISKSTQYAITHLQSKSIAFAVPEVYEKEEVVAEMMLMEAKHQIAKSSSLTVLFVLSPDQYILQKTFSGQLDTMQTNVEFDWSTANRCVLPQKLDNNQLELWGPPSVLEQVKQKYQLMDTLLKQLIQVQQTPRPSSAARLRPSASTATTKCYNITLSSCPQDQIICQRLADRLMDEGFSVLIDLSDEEASSQIDKSDCVIMCLSENYQENDLCEKKAKYANDSRKKLIAVKIESYNTSIRGWLHDFMIGKLCYHLFGSESYFNLEYDKLLSKVLQYTRPGYVTLLQQTGNRTDDSQASDDQQIERKRKRAYEKRVQKLMEKGKISEDDIRNATEKIQIVINEKQAEAEETASEVHKRYQKDANYSARRKRTYKQENVEIQYSLDTFLLCYKRWLKKIPNVTKQNIPPFTLTGDINDAIFPLPDDIRENPEAFARQYFKRSSPFGFGHNYFCSNALLWINNGPFGKIPTKNLQLTNCTFGIPSSQTHEANNYYLSLSKRMGFGMIITSSDRHQSNYPYNGPSIEIDDVITETEAPDNDLKVRRRDGTTRYFAKNDPRKQQQISECVRNFMQQKNRNMLEFDKLKHIKTFEELKIYIKIHGSDQRLQKRSK
ncbi:unnamed protein product [Didymodactylos carnosus]|uniref:TIR domain-containing protein n=1 Tax=Didymodactylos carnosus TaxID=1234261 RepID=A0A8S2DTL4_9BILA|nr:unnamed protein product [Didymodactylos carnosus]CAF3820329.1 unnamed protein product [Didymodactylos carnosus]